jgi:two-component system, chemotaxis family, sensor kinase CheA
MGDGKVALILDALGFYNFADKGSGHKIEKMNDDIGDAIKNTEGELQEILLVDLGDHRTYGIPLSLVNRLEEFSGKNIEWSGDQAIIKYGDIPMPLISIEPILKLKGDSVIELVHKNSNSLVPCVVVKIRGHLYGMLVSNIKDISMVEGKIFTDSIDRDGLLGTIFIQEHSVTLLDVHSILKTQPIFKSIIESVQKKIGRVLLVDDSPLFRRIQGDLLLEQGYDVILANDAIDALSILENDKAFNIIITDIEMPEVNGFEFAKKLRTLGGNLTRIPIIALTSRTNNYESQVFQEAGFNDYIEKTNNHNILKVIQQFI